MQTSIQRKYVDLTGAPDWLRTELFELAGEAEQARAQLEVQQVQARAAGRKSVLGFFLAAVLAGLVGYWRGRRAAQAPRIVITEPKERRA